MVTSNNNNNSKEKHVEKICNSVCCSYFFTKPTKVKYFIPIPKWFDKICSFILSFGLIQNLVDCNKNCRFIERRFILFVIYA